MIVGLPAVLIGFGRVAEILQHRVDRARVSHVAGTNGVADGVVAAVGTQLLELRVGIEYQRRVRKSPGWPRAARMQTNHKKGFFFEAEAEVWCSRIGHYASVVTIVLRIEVGQRLQALPKQFFKQRLVGYRGAFEDNCRAVVRPFGLPVGVYKVVNELQNIGIILRASQVVDHHVFYLLKGECGFGNNAREFLLIYKRKVLVSIYTILNVRHVEILGSEVSKE